MAQIMAPDEAAPVFWTQVVVLHIAMAKGRIPLKRELQSQGYRYGPTACGGISDFPNSPAKML